MHCLGTKSLNDTIFSTHTDIPMHFDSDATHIGVTRHTTLMSIQHTKDTRSLPTVAQIHVKI